MYFSTSGGREAATKRQLDGLCSLLKLTSHIPMFQNLRFIICMRQQDNEGMNSGIMSWSMVTGCLFPKSDLIFICC
jgi:hypothetical protein